MNRLLKALIPKRPSLPCPASADASSFEILDRPLDPFSKLEIDLPCLCSYTYSSRFAVLISGVSEEVASTIQTKVKNGILQIHFRSSAKIKGGFGNVAIGSAGGRAVVKNSIFSIAIGSIGGNVVQSENLTGLRVEVLAPVLNVVQLSSSGDMDMQTIEQEELRLFIQGSGSVAAHGLVKSLHVHVLGSGNVSASSLITHKAELKVMGSGDIDVGVRDSVVATVLGSGNITIHGDPLKCSTQAHGSGKVTVRR